MGWETGPSLCWVTSPTTVGQCKGLEKGYKGTPDQTNHFLRCRIEHLEVAHKMKEKLEVGEEMDQDCLGKKSEKTEGKMDKRE